MYEIVILMTIVWLSLLGENVNAKDRIFILSTIACIIYAFVYYVANHSHIIGC